MDNLKLPAYPFAWEGKEDKDGSIVAVVTHEQSGFTKLELASLMIAQGLVSNPQFGNYKNDDIGEDSVRVAKAVLEECNK